MFPQIEILKIRINNSGYIWLIGNLRLVTVGEALGFILAGGRRW